jgi:DNA adenine methylase
MLDGGYAYGRVSGGASRALSGKAVGFLECADRLRRAHIECYDALKIIKSRDIEDAFFYLDPPYVGSDQGHYDGYTQEDFDMLLSTLEGLKGKFLLSSYRNANLTKLINKNRWHALELKMPSSMTHGKKCQRHKIEVLTANYPIKAPDKAVVAA